MLMGTADPEVLASRTGAATLLDFTTEPVVLRGVETLQVLAEISTDGAHALLPPGLHPTIPPVITWLVQRVSESPWGAFALAQCRIECRSGLRPRGFLTAGVIDNDDAATALAERWGYALVPGDILLRRSYHRTEAVVARNGHPILEVALEDPTPLRSADAYYVANMHLAHTPHGLRLLQIDPDYEVERAERGRPSIRHFDPAAWRCEGARPSHPVSASLTLGSVTLPALRYVCRPDVLAFEGTERVDA